MPVDPAPGTDWATIIAGVGTAIAGGALILTALQHRAIVREQQARAKFRLTLRRVGSDHADMPAVDAVTVTARREIVLLIEVNIKNFGTRAAGPTVVNVVVPQGYRNLRWSGPDGEVLEPEPGIRADTIETLETPDGEVLPARYLAREIPRISRRTNHAVWFWLRCRGAGPWHASGDTDTRQGAG
jgi:hypothetical protein